MTIEQKFAQVIHIRSELQRHGSEHVALLNASNQFDALYSLLEALADTVIRVRAQNKDVA